MQHAETLLTTSDVTRFWRLGDFLVTLRHQPLTNAAHLALNNIDLPPGQLSFSLPDQSHCIVSVSSSSPWLARAGLASWTYTLSCNGRVVEDVIHQPTNPAALRVDAPNVSDPIVSGDRVVWYRVTWASSNPSQSAVDVHRRYRDFFTLYAQVCSAYRASHLYSSVPELPGREVFSPDQLSPEFIEARRLGLETWLRRLVKLPGVAGGLNPDVEEFLGVGGSMGIVETSLVFAPGKLGMRLARPSQGAAGKGSFTAQVAAFLQDEGDDVGQAEASGRVRVGDMIVRVNGESAILIDYDAVVELLRTAARPLVVHFLGVR